MYRTNLRYPYRAPEQGYIPIMDYGLKPLVIDLEEAVEQNRTFRTALWTGNLDEY